MPLGKLRLASSPTVTVLATTQFQYMQCMYFLEWPSLDTLHKILLGFSWQHDRYFAMQDRNFWGMWIFLGPKMKSTNLRPFCTIMLQVFLHVFILGWHACFGICNVFTNFVFLQKGAGRNVKTWPLGASTKSFSICWLGCRFHVWKKGVVIFLWSQVFAERLKIWQVDSSFRNASRSFAEFITRHHFNAKFLLVQKCVRPCHRPFSYGKTLAYQVSRPVAMEKRLPKPCKTITMFLFLHAHWRNGNTARPRRDLMLWWFGMLYMTIDTVDGKNPAPPDMYESLYIPYILQLVGAGFLDHQHYDCWYVLTLLWLCWV